MSALSPRAMDALRTAAVDSTSVRLTCGQLDRASYVEVNEVLTRLGGKWKGGRTMAHVFGDDPTHALADVVESGIMPPKNPLAFFATPPDVVARMLAAAWLDVPGAEPLRVLEPSAGEGAIARAVQAAHPAATIDCVEVDERRATRLRADGFTVVASDFLTYRPDVRYHRVLMNPPFSVAGDALAYIRHVQRGYELLARGGCLVAIAPVGFLSRSDRRCREFREFVEDKGHAVELPPDAFRDSGTGVRTAMVVVTAPDAAVAEDRAA